MRVWPIANYSHSVKADMSSSTIVQSPVKAIPSYSVEKKLLIFSTGGRYSNFIIPTWF